jgi:hypothetical protein
MAVKSSACGQLPWACHETFEKIEESFQRFRLLFAAHILIIARINIALS